MIRIALLGFAFALASGCVTNPPPGTGGGTGGGGTGGGGTGGGGTGGGSDGGTGTGTGGGSISPQAGLWDYGEVTPVSSTCTTTIPHGENGPFAIDQVSTSSFRITPGDGTAPFACSETGAKFSCPNRASFVDDLHPSVDAIITVHATITGMFGGTDHGTGTQQATIDCVGTQCAAVGPLPCTFTVNFAIRAD